MSSVTTYPVKRIVKRDGSVVDFDSNRIKNAIMKAMLSVNKYDEALLEKIVSHVLNIIAEKFGTERVPHVEDVQDIVELSLVKFDQYEVAKSYILYRKEREKIRQEKQRILEKEALDEVDKSFSVNSLRLMASRYLLRNENGKLIEGPKQMLQRVAALIVIPDILYDPRVFDVEGNQPVHEPSEFNPELWSGKVGLKRKGEGYEVVWNRWHLERMKKLYDRFNSEGKMRLPWPVFFEKLLMGEFDDHYTEYLEYYNLMVEKKFMPNSPTLFNAGARLGQLSACFVLPIRDNIESIMKAAMDAAIIFKSGGGIGINYSMLRPQGDIVFSTAGVASGPVSFMKIIDTVTDVVKQGGKRRGANMGILESNHPDIEKFVRAKEKEGILENFNISVMIEPGFWEHLERNVPYSLINPRDGRQWSTIDPGYLFHLIAEMAWKTADPGVLFLDNINKRNVLRHSLGLIRCTNPCGEEPLYDYEPCNLGSINLYAFIRWDGKDGRATFDWDELARATRIAYSFLDNVIDVNAYPLPEIDRMARNTRRIGLGFMGLANALMALRIPYNSEEGFSLMSRMTEFIAWHAYICSIERVKERGAFPLFDQSSYVRGELPLEGYYRRELWSMDWDRVINGIREHGIRNSFIMSIAPTGSISMLVDTSSGLEPVFALVFEKRVTVGVFYYVDPEFERVLRERGLYTDEVLRLVAENGGSIQRLDAYFSKDDQAVFQVAYDVPWWDHVRAQYHVSMWVDAAVSKTINMPSWVSIDDVKSAYLFAYKLGLKGITIFRDQSKSSQVLVTPSQRSGGYTFLVSNDTLNIMKRMGIEVKVRPEEQEAVEQRQPVPQLVVTTENETVTNEEDRCPSCNSTNLAHQETCKRCLECGWSACVVS